MKGYIQIPYLTLRNLGTFYTGTKKSTRDHAYDCLVGNTNCCCFVLKQRLISFVGMYNRCVAEIGKLYDAYTYYFVDVATPKEYVCRS